jgi:hypothetical protein
MKKPSTILLAIMITLSADAQAVLHEIYAYPSVGNHEFFELYTTSASQVPVSVDGYKLISYYESNCPKEFYIFSSRPYP